jgi:shikimate dehydrogenase
VVAAAAAEGAGADPFLFAAPSEREPDAALLFQPSGERLLDEGRAGEVSRRALLFALVGRPRFPSPSPRLHNAAFRALGIDALYLPELDLPLREALSLPLAGWSVTTPWKEEAALLCASLSPAAAATGAVNTVVRRADGSLHGDNTDVAAVARALDGVPPGGPAWVLGGGGFARAAAHALSRVGFAVTLWGGERARRSAASLGVSHAPPESSPPVVAVAVNATPLGGGGEADPLLTRLGGALRRGATAIDAPYGPGASPGAFAALAAAAGARVVDGPTLLRLQARGQVEAFARRPPPCGVLEDALAGGPAPSSIVLVGLRGAGKTTVGRAVAARLGRPFLDTDDDLARRAGRPAGRVLAEEGEAAFRERERASTARALCRRRAVVALGGGALESFPEGLARHRVVHLAVEPAEAARRVERDRATLRPPLAGAKDAEEEARATLAAREATYRRVATAVLRTDGRAVDDVVADVLAVAADPRAPGPRGT